MDVCVPYAVMESLERRRARNRLLREGTGVARAGRTRSK